MHKMRGSSGFRSSGTGSSGFSLLELMVVVAIIAIVSAMVAPSLQAYSVRESARSNAQNIAAVLAEARSRAIDEGRNYIVLFTTPMVLSNPITGISAPIAQVVQDVNNNWVVNGGTDVIRNVFAAPGTKPAVTPYGVGGVPPYNTSPLAPEDVPGGGLADLSALANGTTFPNFAGSPAVGFTPRGIPVNLNTTTVPGSGAGAFYITDNNKTVYAAVLMPLGGVRVRVLDPILNNWL